MTYQIGDNKRPGMRPGQWKEHIMEQRQHPSHPVRELALQVAAAHQLPDDTTDSIVERAEKYFRSTRGIRPKV